MTTRADSISRCVDEAIVVTTHWGEPPRLTFAIDHDKVDREVALVVVTLERPMTMATVLRARAAAVHADFIVPL